MLPSEILTTYVICTTRDQRVPETQDHGQDQL